MLDPLLFTLLDPSIKQQSVMLKVSELRVPVLQYSNAFDQARVHHVLDDLLSLARFGGQGFIRIAKSAFLKHSLDPAFRQRVMDGESRRRSVEKLVANTAVQPSSTRTPTSTVSSPFLFGAHVIYYPAALALTLCDTADSFAPSPAQS